jgi:hypothetical protein
VEELRAIARGLGVDLVERDEIDLTQEVRELHVDELRGEELGAIGEREGRIAGKEVAGIANMPHHDPRERRDLADARAAKHHDERPTCVAGIAAASEGLDEQRGHGVHELAGEHPAADVPRAGDTPLLTACLQRLVPRRELAAALRVEGAPGPRDLAAQPAVRAPCAR